MIVFDLKCDGGHVFEAWFASSGAFAEQREGGLVACPICGDTAVDKAVMAPNVAAKANAGPSAGAAARRVMARIAAVQTEALKTSTWVGGGFAETARAMHEGTRPSAPIHGQATRDEARALVEDGVPVAPLLVPVVPPDRVN